ncbi:uncharacterized protein MONOS_10589 [Monocercomonoides exilis]|uniref:uncharacterized protein n=1 Tax=Monocercomonoides exilis TaxID=2049356 RepID=UPI003559386B|nr:hypothetical protein MONOS_10589 [Monocercomonoides exilis]|eukprot:MONOS_10589.1-p1 / transcript=MONOS_10589.1 / gene=MONOS_10589 / organism=Monocercomonoides_exilis_PA203 / gene_product=unspecified product / transcript_product=unspecified product / location=Mono_scaffold00487:23441-24370(+) / protein_length=310 / sequence_SO=supercontig / SO=protein_coding / is_pseudo=false
MVHKDKCQLEPTKRFTYLGFDCDTEEFTARLEKDKAFSLAALLCLWEKKSVKAKQVRTKDFASLIGKINAVRFIRQDASLLMVVLHCLFQKNVRTTGWSWMMMMNASVLKEKRERKRILNLNKPRQLQPLFFPQATQTTDASELAMVATLRINNRILDWHEKFHKYAHNKSSNFREQFFMLLALRNFSQIIKTNLFSQLSLRSEKSSVVFNINRWRTAKTLRPILRRMWTWKEKMGIHLRAHHIPVQKNSRADSLSRLISAGDYSITEEAFRRILSLTKVRPTVDAFAPQHNHIEKRLCIIGSRISEDG